MRILVFGGSFNPVHWGHLLMAEEVREEFSYDLVLFIPALKSPFKTDNPDPGPEHRLSMLELACRDNPAFRVDDREIRRGGKSWTIDTIRQIRAETPLPEAPGLLLGDDLVEGFGSWRESEALAREAKIIVGRRGGEVHAHAFAEAHNRVIPLSSSEIRTRAGQGLGLRYLLPEAVFAYIREKGLYGYR